MRIDLKQDFKKIFFCVIMQVKRGTGVEVDRSCLKKSSHLVPRRVVVVETRRHGGHVTWREVVKE